MAMSIWVESMSVLQLQILSQLETVFPVNHYFKFFFWLVSLVQEFIVYKAFWS